MFTRWKTQISESEPEDIYSCSVAEIKSSTICSVPPPTAALSWCRWTSEWGQQTTEVGSYIPTGQGSHTGSWSQRCRRRSLSLQRKDMTKLIKMFPFYLSWASQHCQPPPTSSSKWLGWSLGRGWCTGCSRPPRKGPCCPRESRPHWTCPACLVDVPGPLPCWTRWSPCTGCSSLSWGGNLSSQYSAPLFPPIFTESLTSRWGRNWHFSLQIS